MTIAWLNIISKNAARTELIQNKYTKTTDASIKHCDGLTYKEINQQNKVAAANFRNLIYKTLPCNHVTLITGKQNNLIFRYNLYKVQKL